MSWCGERRCGLLPREWLEFVGLRRESFECGRSRWASADSGDAGLAWLAITAPHPLRAQDFLAHTRHRYDDAAAMHRRVLARRPADAQALGNLAVVLHRGLKAYDEAEATYERALQLHPAHATIAVKFGNFIKHARKDVRRAKGLYQQALDSDPQHADALGNLAVLLHSTGTDPDKTEALYRAAVESDPEG